MAQQKLSVWHKAHPARPGYFWFRYVNGMGDSGQPDVLWVLEDGRAFEYGAEHQPESVRGHYEYGPQIMPPA